MSKWNGLDIRTDYHIHRLLWESVFDCYVLVTTGVGTDCSFRSTVFPMEFNGLSNIEMRKRVALEIKAHLQDLSKEEVK